MYLAILDPSVVAAALGAFGAVFVYFVGVRLASLERERKACAQAVADALAWLELPYRVCRRVDDSTETLRDLAERIHGLQERLLFDENWLRIEVPGVYDEYGKLVDAVKKCARVPLQEAWAAPGVWEASRMNVGDLGLASVEPEVRAFAEKVKAQLVLWRFWQ